MVSGPAKDALREMDETALRTPRNTGARLLVRGISREDKALDRACASRRCALQRSNRRRRRESTNDDCR